MRAKYAFSKLALQSLLVVSMLASSSLLARKIRHRNNTKMVRIPKGFYRPLFVAKDDEKSIKVKSFNMDIYPITQQQYLDFVKSTPKWRRSKRKSLFADKNYLASWKTDLKLDPSKDPQSPIVEVSWFAALAYCRSKGKTLPSVAQWEYVGAASAKKRYGLADPSYKEKLIKWYSKPTANFLPKVGTTYAANVYGIYDLHGVIWEWTLDFNTALVTGESRGDSALDKQLFCGYGSVGAADFKDYAAFMRYAFRSSLNAKYTVLSLGFRCVKEEK